MPLTFWDVLDRAINTGEKLSPMEFDKKVWSTTSRILKEHPDIKYNPQTPVPTDESLADEIWEAALEAYLDLGTYCINTERVIKFSESEIKEGLSEVQSEVPIGAGNERKIITLRKIGDKKPPVVIGGIIESDIPEGEMFVKVYQSIAQEPLIDGFYVGPPLHTCEGRQMRVGSPFEIHQAKCVASWAREAVRRAGRPGLFLLLANPSAIADIAACNPEWGIRPTDALAVPTTSELKTDFESLGKVTHSLEYGGSGVNYSLTIIGGWAGGPEGSAIIATASTIMGVMAHQMRGRPAYISPGATMMTPSCYSPKPSLWSTGATLQAVVRNSKIVTGKGAITAAGPGTEMQMLEIAAIIIDWVASGAAVAGGAGGVRRYKVKHLLGSGLENRWLAEVSYAAAGLKPDDANEIVNELLKKYEDRITKEGGPWGHTFDEIYDVKTVTPRKEFLELYDKVKKEMEDLGLKFKR
ncbi:MAG: monomethylamine:corrinoid methyltransferase [Candidatus Hadarchaeum sp.]|uniref:monomethylamine:corrinoid methyltransferase n=3 Tax=Candidatus Hadarchaeum sp. TaxID=2883567 RepID=UPI00316B40D3